jgi:hypothetical protein
MLLPKVFDEMLGKGFKAAIIGRNAHCPDDGDFLLFRRS